MKAEKEKHPVQIYPISRITLLFPLTLTNQNSDNISKNYLEKN